MSPMIAVSVVNCFQIINFDTLKTTGGAAVHGYIGCELLSNY